MKAAAFAITVLQSKLRSDPYLPEIRKSPPQKGWTSLFLLVKAGINMQNQMTLNQMIEYVATCPVCGGYVMVFNAETQDFTCTCCKRVWLNGVVKKKGVYEQ